MPNFAQYQSEVAADIAAIIKQKACQPILFVGSGFSKRYCGAPSWEELLTMLADWCPEIKHDYAYYRQSKLSMPEIGSLFASAYKEWAWGEAKPHFPAHYFNANVPEDAFIKYVIAEKLRHLGPDKAGKFGVPELDSEITALKAINPHAVISTNYDLLLEPIFPAYTPIIGQQVIRHAYMSIGEVFKIHGCLSDPGSMIFTKYDYEKFANDKKYLSAKMFTYFVEHPLLFIGYSASDENIRAILHEIDHMLPEGEGLIENIYLLEWKKDIKASEYPKSDKIIDIGGGRTIRIKSITADSFEWVFKAFCSEAPIEKVNVKLLRSISHRVVDLVRKDAAKNTVEINFEMLNHALEHPGDFAKVFGIAAMADPALLNVMYPFSPTAAAELLGYKKDWNKVNQLITALKIDHGFDMRASDNHFHVGIPAGPRSNPIRKYSQAGIDLLIRVRDGGVLPDLKNPTVTGVKAVDVAPAGIAPAAP
jgi:hypothetical protein